MTEIHVDSLDEETYRVRVIDDGESSHRVRASKAELANLGGGAAPETLIEESFRFLLEREPRQSILERFDLPDIARYFPEYPQEIRLRLQGTVD